jgi:hypothetical protein
MPSKTKKFVNKTIKPMMGGALLQNLAGESASGEHYTKKLNFRRHQEGEARREGWEIFKPSGKFLEGFPQVATNSPSTHPIRLICQFRSNNNISCLVVAAGDKIYRYKYDANPEYINKNAPTGWAPGTYWADGYVAEPPADFKWEIIAEGLNSVDDTTGDYFANEVNAWEATVVNGTLYLNNGKDLPLAFKENWRKAIPLLELRESPAYRVAAIGTISEFNGFLMLADVTQIVAEDWVDWMKGADPYGPVLDSTTYNNGETKTIRSPYSLIWSYEGDGLRYGTALYGTMQEGTNQFISKYPLMTDTSGDYSTNSEHPAITFSVREGTEVIIVGAGDTIATVEGEEVNNALATVPIVKNGVTRDSRIKIGSVVDNTNGTQTYGIVDEEGNPANATGSITDDELATPIINSTTGYMIRLDSVGKLTSVADLVDDGSRIIKMKTLVDRLMIYRDTGYMTAIKVNTAEVFQFERRYTGPRVVDFRNTLIDVAGRYHIFMGFTGVYQTDRAASQPKLLQAMDKGTRFWEGLSADQAERVFTVDNGETKEIFFCSPEGTFAFDYENNTVSEVDQIFTAGAQIIRPATTKRIEYRWVVFGVSDAEKNIAQFEGTSENIFNFLVRYGKGPDNYAIYNRYGNEYRSVLQSGLIDFTDQFNDKDVRSYALHVAENTLFGLPSNANVKVRIATLPTAQSANPDITEVELNEDGEYEFASGERVEAEHLMDNTTSENMLPLYLRGPYFRDAIIIEGKDNPMKLIGRTFEVSGVASKLAQAAPNQG